MSRDKAERCDPEGRWCFINYSSDFALILRAMKSTGEGKARFGLISLAHSKELPEADSAWPRGRYHVRWSRDSSVSWGCVN